MNTVRMGIASLAIGLTLSGCSALLSGGIGGIGGIASQAGSIAGQVDDTINGLILQKYQALHNLRAGMDAIDASPGPVIMTTPAPIITPVPMPAPMPTPPVVNPSPTAPSSPIVTPNARRFQQKSSWPAFDFSGATP